MPNGAEADDAYVAARLPGTDRPNLNGVWQALNEANYDIERHLARPSVSLREGPYGPLPDLATVKLGAVASVPPSLGVVDGDIPYTPEALAIRDENRRLWIERDPEIKCFLPGVPRATYMPQPFQILQGERETEIVYQWAGAVRNIYSEDPGHPAPVDSWMGHSVLSWEGDTMVLTVTGLNEQTWFDRAGNHHSNQMTVVERYTPTSANHLHYEATIEDPETFTRPWTISMPLYRRMEPDAMILDFKCVAFVEELMYGKWRRNPLPQWDDFFPGKATGENTGDGPEMDGE